MAVSGGPDSVALLWLFAELWRRSPQRFDVLVALHVNHGIRGAAADEDEAFVRQQARSLGIELHATRADVPREARESGESVEVAGRRARYEAFRRWAQELGLEAIATAHHREDQAETVLYRALRGAGWRGLAGIPARRWLGGPASGVRVIRPLLDWGRQELRDLLAERGVSYREDASNRDPRIPRSFLRETLLPLAAAHVHPGASRSLARLAGIAREHAAGLRQLARRALRSARVPEGAADGVQLRVEALRRWPVMVARETILLAMEPLCGAGGGGGARPGLRYRDSQRLARWLSPGGPASGRLEVACQGLPGERLVLELRYGIIMIRIARGGPPAAAGGPETALVLDGAPVVWGDWELLGFLSDGAPPPAPSPGGWLEEHLDAESVASLGPLCWRARREGDRFWPLGAPGRKKLKELFRERRIAPAARGGVPLLAAGGDIVWVVGERIGHPYRVQPATRRMLVLRARRLPGHPAGLT